MFNNFDGTDDWNVILHKHCWKINFDWSTPTFRLPIFREGERIEARYRGKIFYYAGRIGKVNNDHTYDVEYNDGKQCDYSTQ